MKARDAELAISVLQGQTFEYAGQKFGMTRERARQIAWGTIAEVDPELINRLRSKTPGRRKGISATDELRSQADRLIPLIEKSEY